MSTRLVNLSLSISQITETFRLSSETAPVISSASSETDENKIEAGPSSEPSHLNSDKPAEEPKPQSLLARQLEQLDKNPIDGDWYEPRNLRIIIKYRTIPWIIKVLLHGSSMDIHQAQAGEAGTKEGDHMRAVFAAAKQYPNELEHTYSFVQVLTACTASFAHGANDLGNAIGPWSVIYSTWKTGLIQGEESEIPVWMLIVGALTLVLGLATYGYNIMRVLGNKITYMSPSRGSSMELAAAITVILASQYGLPVVSLTSLFIAINDSWLTRFVYSQRQCASQEPQSV